MSARVAVVTGATRGIGAAIVARLLANRFRVIAVARHPVDSAMDGVEYRQCDVADAAAARAVFAGVGRLDALVNNAGIAGANRLDVPDDTLWHAIMATNLHAAWYCCTAAVPLLRDGVGRIVNVGSILGLRGAADQTAYCAAKHGLIGLTRALALALGPRGITVNAVCPGWVDTGMAAGRFAELGMTRADAVATMPTGRMTTPEEIAEVIAFLLGPAAANVTGHALPVDGGSLASP